MFARLLLIFVLVPLADLVLLLLIGRMNWWLSVALVIVSGFVGAFFARRQGFAVGNRIRERLVRNEMPTEPLVDGGIVLFAAGLLITPGLITDLFGLSLLIPICRRWYRKRLIAWFKKRFRVEAMATSGSFGFGSPVVDSYVVRDDEDESDDIVENRTGSEQKIH